MSAVTLYVVIYAFCVLPSSSLARLLDDGTLGNDGCVHCDGGTSTTRATTAATTVQTTPNTTTSTTNTATTTLDTATTTLDTATTPDMTAPVFVPNDSDLCRNNPCENGGICIILDGLRSFSCKCPTDYFGDLCNKRTREMDLTTVFPTPRLFLDANDLNDLALMNTWKKDIAEHFFKNYGAKMGKHLKSVSVWSITKGSLIVNYTLVYDDTDMAGREATAAIVDLTTGDTTVTILNETTQASSTDVSGVVIARNATTTSARICEIYIISIGGCETSCQCKIIDGQPSCVVIKSSEGLGMHVGIVVGIPVFIAIAVLIMVLSIVSVKSRRRKAKATQFHPRNN